MWYKQGVQENLTVSLGNKKLSSLADVVGIVQYGHEIKERRNKLRWIRPPNFFILLHVGQVGGSVAVWAIFRTRLVTALCAELDPRGKGLAFVGLAESPPTLFCVVRRCGFVYALGVVGKTAPDGKEPAPFAIVLSSGLAGGVAK